MAYGKRGRELEAPLRAASRKHLARYLSLIDALCPDAKCRTVDSTGAPLQFDYFHPTRGGALLIVEQWRGQSVFVERMPLEATDR